MRSSFRYIGVQSFQGCRLHWHSSVSDLGLSHWEIPHFLELVCAVEIKSNRPTRSIGQLRWLLVSVRYRPKGHFQPHNFIMNAIILALYFPVIIFIAVIAAAAWFDLCCRYYLERHFSLSIILSSFILSPLKLRSRFLSPRPWQGQHPPFALRPWWQSCLVVSLVVSVVSLDLH